MCTVRIIKVSDRIDAKFQDDKMQQGLSLFQASKKVIPKCDFARVGKVTICN